MADYRLTIVIIILFSLSCVSCSDRFGQSRSIGNGVPESDREFTCSLPISLTNRNWKLKAWESINANERFCIAQPSDFRISTDSVRDKWTRIGIDGFTHNPVLNGDLNHDKRSDDIAVFVVDHTNPGPERFSVLIMNEPQDENTTPKVFWLYKDQDLSNAMFIGGSGVDGICRFRENGDCEYSVIDWNEMTQSYVISKK